MWHVAPESKIQLVNCELSPKFPLGHLLLPDIRAIDAYIFWSLLLLPLLHARLTFSSNVLAYAIDNMGRIRALARARTYPDR